MRALTVLTPVILGLALAACSTTSGANRYVSEQQRLADDCRARGGILTSTGEQSGRPQQDNVCVIRGQPASVPSN
jgi:outer membrane PBP1 activator LpoA protein